ncbi:YncE family protein [Shouchella lonarensis]|uniref:40-residue YVTN family beta-propeller repeat-containing protein n=1 Tax=Shouchella lonarensis TaxID=1464122 RepID=A0A1G6J573_9BACI|nr:YncE family protein [Shouchella lonarensis]SDC13769.1 40-residue YVTN family beta-propeller repeat-containing protein [Shouchella lonarensis]
MLEEKRPLSSFLAQQSKSAHLRRPENISTTAALPVCEEPCQLEVPFQVEFLLQSPFQLPIDPAPIPVFTFQTNCLQCTSEPCTIETEVDSPCNDDALAATTTIRKLRVVGNLSFLVSLGPIVAPGGGSTGASLSQFGQVCMDQVVCYTSEFAPVPCPNFHLIEVDPNSIQIDTTPSPGGSTLIQLTGSFVLPDCHGDPSQSLLYVTNAGTHDVSVIESVSGNIINTVPVGESPFHIALTPDKNNAYVPNSGENSTSVLDVNSNTVVATIIMSNPHFAAITPNGAYAYITSPNTDTVYVVDTTSYTITETISVSGAIGIDVTPDGAYVYVTDGAGDSVAVIETASNTVTDHITVGEFPSSVAVTPNGAYAYVTNFATDINNDHSVSVIETASNMVVATVIVGDSPSSVTITPDGTRAYVTHALAPVISVIDTSTNAIVQTIPASESFGLAITSDGALGYVTRFWDNEISVFETTSNSIIGTFLVGAGPAGIAVN